MSTTSPTASLSAEAAAALEGLRARCPLHRPGDLGYDVARTPWNLAVDVRPAAVAVPRTVDEVRDVVRTAASVGLRVADYDRLIWPHRDGLFWPHGRRAGVVVTV